MKKIFLLLNLFVGILLSQELPHVQLSFDCEVCHSPENWQEIHFNHSEMTGWPLSGSHQELFCTACHTPADFKQVGSRCVDCHADVHQEKLGGDCQRCHNPASWSRIDAEAIHASTAFPLMGVHLQLDCNSCHISEITGEFSFLKSECISCHQEQFNTATNPSHKGMGFSLQCELCHTLVSWRPAGFKEHDARFPIYSGEHAGEWATCQDCHFSPDTYQIFSCIHCHEHRQSKMDDKHKDVPGYQYNSEACYQCHPTGKGD